jgi:carboxyl-terminal processing protease
MEFIRQRFQFFNLLGCIILCAMAFGAGAWMTARNSSPEERLIGAAYRLIRRDAIYNQQSDLELSYAAIRGMLVAIQDPFAELIEPQAGRNFTSTFTGQTGVIGLYAEKQANQVVITIVFPGGSASLAGIQEGDVILAIDNETLDKDTDSSETGLRLRGEPGTTVHLKISRAGQVFEYDLVRRVREFVSSRLLPEGIGYLALNAFNRTATQQMKAALETLLAQQPAGLIWDLRNNEGGDMQAAQDVLSFFIEDGLLFTAASDLDRSDQLFGCRNLRRRGRGNWPRHHPRQHLLWQGHHPGNDFSAR